MKTWLVSAFKIEEEAMMLRGDHVVISCVPPFLVVLCATPFWVTAAAAGEEGVIHHLTVMRCLQHPSTEVIHLHHSQLPHPILLPPPASPLILKASC